MKKAKSILFIAAVSALAVTGAAGEFPGLLRTPLKGADEQQTVSHAIKTDVDPAISLTVKSSAAAGEIVTVEAKYDSAKVTLNALLVNGKRAAKDETGAFYFVMPDSDVTITADAIVEGSYSLVSLSSDTVEIYGQNLETFDPGDKVSFSLGIIPNTGVTITGVEIGVLDEGGSDIATPIEFQESYYTYSFTAPEDLTRNIGVKVETEARMYSLSWDNSMISSVYEVEDDGEETDIRSRKLAYPGHTIKIRLSDSNKEKATGIIVTGIDEPIMLGEDSDTVEFTMPSHSVEITVLSEKIYVPITVSNTETSTVTLYTLDEATDTLVPMAENKAAPQDRVYLSAASSDEDVKVTGYNITYSTTYSDNNSITAHSDDYGTYFDLPYSCTSVTVKPVESHKMLFTFTPNERFTVKAYSELGNFDSEINGAFEGDTVYLAVARTEAGTGLSWEGVDVRYTTSTGTYKTAETQVESGWYKFEMQEGGTDWTISVIESEDNTADAYADCPFVGTYYKCYDVYRTTEKEFDPETYEFTAGGSFDESRVIKVEQSESGKSGTIYLSDGKVFAYGENFLFSYYSTHNRLDNHDIDVYYKGTETNIKVDALFAYPVGEDYRIGFIQIVSYDENNNRTVLASFATMGSADIRYLEDVTIEHDAAKLSESDTATLKVNGETIGTITGGTSYDATYTPAE